MEERFENHPDEVKRMSTEQLRNAFVINNLMQEGAFHFVYSHYDRMITGGVVPLEKKLELPNFDALKSKYFLERREMGIINIGGKGIVNVDGKSFDLSTLDCLYIGKESKSISFESTDTNDLANFYILSAPAHQKYETLLMKNNEAETEKLGQDISSNRRTIYRYIHENGIKSCQLVMGLTILESGNVWNTMPAHTHNRRMEVYLYFGLEVQARVFHLMGDPSETRHVVLKNKEAVISAPWSIHAGCGTSNYSFIWGMAGENQSFTDMDFIPMENLK